MKKKFHLIFWLVYPTVAFRQFLRIGLGVACIIASAGHTNGQAIEKGMAIVTHYADTNNTSNRVARVFDTRNNANAPKGQDWLSHTPAIDLTPSTWTLANLGEVFGISIDSIGNVYLAASDIYRMDSVLSSDIKGYTGPAGPAGIYRADAAVLSNINVLIGTANTSTPYPVPTTMIPNTGGIGNGIGNIAYDQKHHQLFASNLEDGRIYRIDLRGSPPQVVSIYDPMAPDDGQPGIAPRQEQIWGLAVHTDTIGISRLYFSRRGLGPAISSEIRTLSLQSNGEFGGTSLYDQGIYKGGSQVAFAIKSTTSDTSRITDIAFSEEGRMLLAERGHPHRASVYEYQFNGTNWEPSLNAFYVGGYHLLQGEDGRNAAGGVDYGYRQRGSNVYGYCDSTVWATTNYLLTPFSGSGVYYGIEGMKAGGNQPISQGSLGNGFTDWVIDVDASSRTYVPMGDVEIYRSSCATSWKGPINHILACNDLLQVSLGTDGTIQLNADIVTQGRGTNPCWVFEVFTPRGEVIPDARLTCEWVGHTLDYQVRDTCVNNACWGKIKLEDKYTPPIMCKTDTIECHQSTLPDSLGFPVPLTAQVYPTLDPQQYEVHHWDSCGTVTLWYSDERLTNFSCGSEYKMLVRQWNARDIHGNSNRCFDTIRIKRPTIVENLLPLKDTTLDCAGPWIQLPNGAPAPSVTGSPIAEGCDWVTSHYVDDISSTCGSGFLVLRKWIVSDLCGKGVNKVREIYQLIDVRDATPPSIACPGPSLPMDTISTTRFDCSAQYTLPIPNLSPNGLTVTDDCSLWQYRIKYIPHKQKQPGYPDELAARWLGGFKRPQEMPFILSGMGLGRHWFEYEIRDDCGNSSSCRIQIYVADRISPDIVCEGHTEISLNSSGVHRLYASALDDGTTDNCAVDRFLIRRVDRLEHCGRANATFEEYVTFCCMDVGKTILVELMAIDPAGNTSSCMIDVAVSEKYPPTIIPPSDLTIDCRYNYDTSNLQDYFGRVVVDEALREDIRLPGDDHYSAADDWHAGRDGLATDNCGPLSIKDTAIFQVECGRGTIKRIFYVSDAGELSDSAVQTILIEDLTPFTEKDIHWPKDVLDPPFESDCSRGLNTAPSTQTRVDSAYGFRNLECADIGVTYTDKVFTQEDGACYKIVRTWTVIDWCTYEQNGRQSWEYTQLIKVANHIPPTIDLSTCADTTICDFNSFRNGEVCSSNIHLAPKATDDCTPSEELSWSYRLDVGNSGTFGPLHQAAELTETLPLGNHRIKWYVEDACGNVSTCTKNIVLQDCKPPTPYCRDQIITVPMSSSGTVAINAEQFDLGATDNCTDQEELIFSFTPDGHTPQIIFSCADLYGQTTLDTVLEIYVIDASGNRAACTASVRLQANDNCKGSTISISGHFEQYDGVGIENVEISVFAPGAQNPIKQMRADSQYLIEGLPLNTPYELRSTQRANWKDGVNTRDLVMIKKYLLNLLDFDDAWQFIAADANNSGSISTADISILRKLILGKLDSLKKNDSWILYDPNIDWGDIDQLKNQKGVINIPQGDENIANVDWTGIKIGDVTGERNGLRGEPKSSADLVIEIKQEKEEKRYSFIALSEYNGEAIQGTIALPNDITSLAGKVLSIGEEDYALYEDGVFTLAWFNFNGVIIHPGDTLFTATYHNANRIKKRYTSQPVIGDSITPNFVFGKEGIEGRLRLGSADGYPRLKLYPCYPNPAREQTTIRFDNPSGEKGRIEVFAPSGELLFTDEIAGHKGHNSYRLGVDNLPSKGVLLYRIRIRQTAVVGKVVVQ